MAAQAGLCLAWSETPEDTFSRGAAKIYFELRTNKKLTGFYCRSVYIRNKKVRDILVCYFIAMNRFKLIM